MLRQGLQATHNIDERQKHLSAVSLRPLLADVKIGFLCCFNALSLCRGLLQGWQHNPLEMVALPCGHSHPEMNSVNNCDVVMTSLVTQR